MNPMNPNFRELREELEKIKRARRIRNNVYYALMITGFLFTIYMFMGGHL